MTSANTQPLLRLWGRLKTTLNGLCAIVAAEPKNLAPVKAPIAAALAILEAPHSSDALEDVDYHVVRVEEYIEPWQPGADGLYVPPKWASDMDHELKEARRLLTDLKRQASILPSAHEAKNDTPMKASGPDAPNRKPSVFIGSSSEGLQVARCLQMEMDYEAEVTIWHQGVFGLSGGTLESLVRKVSDFDFAVLVLTPDDVVRKREKINDAPRDNVLFELGLFMGTLGRERTYIVHPRVQIDLPSDLAGITPATYEPNRSDGNLQAAVGSAAAKMLAEIKRLGRR